MKINIIAVGKIKEKCYTDAVQEYVKRSTRFADITVIEVADAPQGKSPEEQSKIEGERLLEKAKGYIVTMDGGGKELSSPQLAELIDKKCSEGASEFSFLIGGSHGHSDEVKARADMLLSFGKPTFPHQLFRVMLSEQIYRALSIINGLPYHK